MQFPPSKQHKEFEELNRDAIGLISGGYNLQKSWLIDCQKFFECYIQNPVRFEFSSIFNSSLSIILETAMFLK